MSRRPQLSVFSFVPHSRRSAAALRPNTTPPHPTCLGKRRSTRLGRWPLTRLLVAPKKVVVRSARRLRVASRRSLLRLPVQRWVRFVIRLKLSWKRELKRRLLNCRTWTVARTSPGSIWSAFQSTSQSSSAESLTRITYVRKLPAGGPAAHEAQLVAEAVADLRVVVGVEGLIPAASHRPEEASARVESAGRRVAKVGKENAGRAPVAADGVVHVGKIEDGQ